MPNPIAFESPELQSNESFKGFADQDSLGKAYVELQGRVANGDVTILSEDLRKDPTVANYKNINEIAKGLIETKKLVGQIKKAPASPTDYKFSPVTGTHKGIAVEATQKTLAELFHKAGLHGEQADIMQQGLLASLSKGLQANDDARSAKAKEVETSLRNEWGGNYDKNFNNIVNVLKNSGAEELASTIGGDPKTLKAMAKITALLSEDSIGKLGGSTDSGSPNTSEGALKALQSFNEDVQKQGGKHPWIDAKHPDHAKTKAAYNKLFEVAYGGK